MIIVNFWSYINKIKKTLDFSFLYDIIFTDYAFSFHTNLIYLSFL